MTEAISADGPVNTGSNDGGSAKATTLSDGNAAAVEVVRRGGVPGNTSRPVDAPHIEYRSWPFRLGRALSWLFDRALGLITMVVLVAVAANIPIVQFASFGFLLHVTARVGGQGRLRDGFPGLGPAAVVGWGLLGTMICLIPLYLIGQFWYSAYLIDATSSPARNLRVLQWVVAWLTVLHILAAWFCGGRFRHFVWPLIAPFSFAGRCVRLLLGTRLIHPLVRLLAYPVSRQLANDIAQIPALKDWFLPAILIHRLRQRRLWSDAREGLWRFVTGIPFGKIWVLGFFGFLGTSIWLFLPTMLMIASTSRETPGAVLIGLLGSLLGTGVFAVLLPLQSAYAVSGRFRDLFRLGSVWSSVRRAPLWHFLAILITLIMALPLFLLKIEEIPDELKWTLSLVFVLTGWVSRIALGWAFARANKATKPRAWFWGIPMALLILPVSFAFVVVLFFTRYISWHGAWSLIENPVFLLPAPFWL